MDAPTLLVEALDQRWGIYQEQLKICRREYSEKSIHDLRVATRRLLALIDLIRDVSPHPRLKKIRQSLKRQLDEFDELRDTQMMLDEISARLESLPALKLFQDQLKHREKRLLREAEYLVEMLKLGGLSTRLGKVRASLSELPASPAFIGQIFQAVDDAYLTVVQRHGWINPAQPVTIHRMRIAFKKFRYMVEIVHPLLPDFPEAQFKQMQAYQTAMGDIQDVEVLLHNLAEFATQETAYDPQPVRAFYQARHAEVISAFIQEKGEIVSFWRGAATQAFPWQAQI